MALFNSAVEIRTITFESLLGAEDTTLIAVSTDLSSVLSIESSPLSSIVTLRVFSSFSSSANISINTISDAHAEKSFVSSLPIVFDTSTPVIGKSVSIVVSIEINTSDIDAYYKITGNKKLEYLVNKFTPDHIEYFNPKFKDLFRVFLRYLDYNPIYKTLTITNNNDLNKIFPEFLDNYLNQYLNNIIDLDKYDLTEKNKQLFLLLSRLLNNSKGTQKAFSYLFRSLTDIRIANEDITIAVDKIITDYIENETWWNYPNPLYHDGTYYHDGVITHNASVRRPFTYQFKIDQSVETMLPLIRAVHPAGFQREFLIEMDFEDEQELNDVLKTSTTYYHFYSSGVPNRTIYYHDGTIDRSGSHITIEED